MTRDSPGDDRRLAPMSGSGGTRSRRDSLEGYFSGEGAPIRAIAQAVARAKTARAVVLVEGISDQIALETLAPRIGRDLAVERVVVVPMGGAHEISRHLERFGPPGARLPISGLCDAAEESLFGRSLAAAGIGTPRSRADLAELGFFVCVEDLEDELIRASGRETIEGVLAVEGDLPSFRTLQRQPDWRAAAFDEQFHRWLRAGARRHLRYARLLVEEIELEDIPRPLRGVLAASEARS